MPSFNKTNYFLVGLLSLFLFSCIADDFNKMQTSNWNPELAIPLIDSRIGIDRLVGKFNEGPTFLVDDEDVVILVYKGDLFELRADSLIKLNDVTFDLALLQNSGISNYPSQQFLLKSVDFKSGILKIHIEDDLKEDTRITLNMPETIKNGQSFKESFVIHYKGEAITKFDTSFSLDDYNMNLSGNGNEKNKLKIDFTAITIASNDSVVIDQFILSFQDLEYNFIDGSLGYMDLGDHEDTLHLDIFDNFKSGRIILQDPKIRFHIENSFGLPIKLSFGNFNGSGSGGSSTLGGKGIDEGIDVTSPSSSSDPPSVINKEINSSNSNISEFLSISPDALSYSMKLEANADGDTSTYNFVSDESEIIGKIDLEVPLKGSLDSVIIEDIYTFSGEEMKGLDQATFKMLTDNSFPVGIYVQIYFLNSDSLVIDSLVEGNNALFKEAMTDAEGFSIGPVFEESYFTIGSGRFHHIRDFATLMKIRVMLLSDDSDNKIVKITSDDYFDLKLGVRARLNR